MTATGGTRGEGGPQRGGSPGAAETASRILQPVGWPRGAGYANGIAASGRIVVVAGQIGWNPLTSEIETDEIAAQTRQALMNVAEVLRAGDADPGHVVRMTWFITDRKAYVDARREIGRIYRDIFGEHYPAMTVVVVAGLLEDRAMVEIEATAVVPHTPSFRS